MLGSRDEQKELWESLTRAQQRTLAQADSVGGLRARRSFDEPRALEVLAMRGRRIERYLLHPNGHRTVVETEVCGPRRYFYSWGAMWVGVALFAGSGIAAVEAGFSL